MGQYNAYTGVRQRCRRQFFFYRNVSVAGCLRIMIVSEYVLPGYNQNHRDVGMQQRFRMHLASPLSGLWPLKFPSIGGRRLYRDRQSSSITNRGNMKHYSRETA